MHLKKQFRKMLKWKENENHSDVSKMKEYIIAIDELLLKIYDYQDT